MTDGYSLKALQSRIQIDNCDYLIDGIITIDWSTKLQKIFIERFENQAGFRRDHVLWLLYEINHLMITSHTRFQGLQKPETEL